MKKYLEYLKKEKEVQDLLKRYGLNFALSKALILGYEFNVSSKIISQKFGVHKSTTKRYYEQFGMMLESDFKKVFDFYYKIKKDSLKV